MAHLRQAAVGAVAATPLLACAPCLDRWLGRTRRLLHGRARRRRHIVRVWIRGWRFGVRVRGRMGAPAWVRLHAAQLRDVVAWNAQASVMRMMRVIRVMGVLHMLPFCRISDRTMMVATSATTLLFQITLLFEIKRRSPPGLVQFSGRLARRTETISPALQSCAARTLLAAAWQTSV